MDTEQKVAAGLIAARAVHFGACLLALGVVAFDQFIAAPALKGGSSNFAHHWRRSANRMFWLSLLFVLLSGVGWFALNAITMSGLPPRAALQPDVLKVVLTETHFGRLWELRDVLWIATVLAGGLLFERARGFALLVLTLVLAGSLAWAGHGTEGNPSGWHLAADLVHLVIGALWPVGLLPFLVLLAKLRKWEGPERWDVIAAVTRRFSATSLASVIVLTATGLINSLYLVGSPAHLFTTDYGKALTTKLAIFLVMIALGAMNLLRWKPRLSAAPDERAAQVAARLQRNVAIEIALGAIVVLVVGLLGLLPPAIDAITHHHHH